MTGEEDFDGFISKEKSKGELTFVEYQCFFYSKAYNCDEKKKLLRYRKSEFEDTSGHRKITCSISEYENDAAVKFKFSKGFKLEGENYK